MPCEELSRRIHSFMIGDKRYVLDINSGSLHEVDEAAWEAIGRYAGGGRDVSEAQAEIQALVDQGLLFSLDPGPITPPAGGLKALCLHVAHDCNLQCRYCFAGGGRFGGGRNRMSLAVARAAVDFLVAEGGDRAAYALDFFGGEPLLNMPAVRETVEYARSRGRDTGKSFRFTLTTNAVQLDDETIEFLDGNMDNVVLSLDGRRPVHNAMRRTIAGRGSYDVVVANILKFVARRGARDYYVRGTYTRANLDFSQDALHLADLGIRHMSLEPVVAGPDEPYALREGDMPLVTREYRRLAAAYIQRAREDRPFSFFHFNLETSRGPCLYRRVSGCGAGDQYLAVTPDGDLYPCHQFVGRPEFKMGDVFAGITRPDLRERFRQAHLFNKQDCPECWARYYCSGGCHANAAAFNGDILKPHRLGCELTRARLECALFVQAALAERE